MLGGMLVDGGFAELAACAQAVTFRQPKGSSAIRWNGRSGRPSSQRTVTGAGSIIIQAAGEFRPGGGQCV